MSKNTIKFLVMINLITISIIFTSCKTETASTSHTEGIVQETETLSNNSENTDMPNIIVETNNGSFFDLSKTDKPALVNFWATWCPPCRSEMPALQNLYEEYKDRMDFILIDAGETKEEVDNFISEQKYTFPVAYDTDDSYSILFNITAIPTTYLVGKDKKIKKYFLGATSEEDFKAAIEEVINE